MSGLIMDIVIKLITIEINEAAYILPNLLQSEPRRLFLKV